MSEVKPHGANFVYQILQRKRLKDVFSQLRGERGKSGAAIFIMALIGTCLLSAGVGIAVYRFGINPPIPVIGVCSSPAVEITNQQGIVTDCVTYHLQTIQQPNGVNQIKNVTSPAGQLYLENGQKYGGR